MSHVPELEHPAKTAPSLTVHLLTANAAFAIFFHGTLLRVQGESVFFETRALAQGVVARLNRQGA